VICPFVCLALCRASRVRLSCNWSPFSNMLMQMPRGHSFAASGQKSRRLWLVYSPHAHNLLAQPCPHPKHRKLEPPPLVSLSSRHTKTLYTDQSVVSRLAITHYILILEISSKQKGHAGLYSTTDQYGDVEGAGGRWAVYLWVRLSSHFFLFRSGLYSLCVPFSHVT